MRNVWLQLQKVSKGSIKVSKPWTVSCIEYHGLLGLWFNYQLQMDFWEIDANTVALKFFGEIGNFYRNASDFTNTFNMLERKYGNIIIKAHCYGGSVFEGNVIFNAINQSRCNVIYEIVGVSASMSTIVQLAANKVRICENAFVMVHRPSAGTDGNADDLFSMAKLLKSLEGNFIKNYKAKTGRKDAEITKLMDGTDHWLTAQEALDFGLVDEIIPAQVKDLNGLPKPNSTQEADNIYQQFTASLTTEIPIVTNPIQNVNQHLMKELIIAMFGLTTVNKDSSDTAVAAALQGIIGAKENKIALLEASVNNLRASEMDTLIVAAETRLGKPFDQDKKASLQAIGKESMAALKMAISFLEPLPVAEAPAAAAAENKPAAAPVALNLIAGGKASAGVPAERAAWKWGDWCEKDETGLLALSEEVQASIYKNSYGVEMPK